MNNTQKNLLKGIADIIGIEVNKLQPSTRLDSIESWDSLSQLAVMNLLEIEYGVSKSYELFYDISTIGDILSAVGQKVTQCVQDDEPILETKLRIEPPRRENKSLPRIEFLNRLSQVTSIPYNKLQLDVKLDSIEEWDSIAYVATALFLKDQYQISISPHEFSKLVTVQDLLEKASKGTAPAKVKIETEDNVQSNSLNPDTFVPIVQKIIDYAALSPEKNALIFSDFSISYLQLANGIKKTATMLQHQGVRQGDIVAVFAEKRPEFFYTYFATHYLGAIVLNMDSHTNENRLSLIFDEAKPLIVVGNVERCQLSFDEVSSFKTGKTVMRADIQPDTVADIMFTTGTTGGAKGVPLSHENIQAAATQINSFIGTQSDDIEVVALPICHSFGMGRIRCILQQGGTAILVNGFNNPNLLFTSLRDYKATGFSFVPAAWAYLQHTTQNKIASYATSLRYIEIGSAAMSTEKKEELCDLFPECRICMHYGLTEASRSAFLEFHSERAHLDSAGKATNGVEIAIYSEDGQLLPAETEGEICIRGRHVMRAYLHSENASGCYFNGYFRTGDWGMIDKDGYLHILSRTKDIINSGGKKISPDEVEQALLQVPGIADCACISAPDPQGILGEVVKAILVSDGGDKPSLAQLRQQLQEKLENYKLPSLVEWRSELPRTSSGKLQRVLLRESL